MWKKTNVPSMFCATGADKGGGGGTPLPRNWVHKKIPGCAVAQWPGKNFFFVKIEGLSSFT